MKKSILKLSFFVSLFFFLFNAGLFSQSVVYVDADASGNNDGTGWGDAYNSLQDALDNAEAGDTIWVAEGTYYPTVDRNGNSSPGDSRTKTFQLVDSVSIFGGFAGTESSFNQRNISDNTTILSGDLGTLEDSTDNCYTVVYGADSLTIDGFTITKGNADGIQNSFKEGAGMRNESVSDMRIAKCKFTKNWAVGHGGGIYNDGFVSSLTLDSCIFVDNGSHVRGGAVTNYGSDTVIIYNCLFVSNYGNYDGGAVYSWYSEDILIDHCTFYKNNTGAIRNSGSGIYKTTNSIFFKNTSEDIKNGWNVDNHYETYNRIAQSGFAGIDGNIDDNPMLYFSGKTELDLNSASPCIDTGDPAYPLDSDATRTDIGFSHNVFTFSGNETDMALYEVLLPEVRTNIGSNDVRIRMANMSPQDTLYSWRAQIKIDANDLGDTLINQEVAPMDTVDVTIRQNANFDEGVHALKVWVFPETKTDLYHFNDTLETTIRSLPYLDVGITEISSPNAVDTASSYDIVATLKNFHTDSTINTATIYYQINSGTEKTYHFNGAIGPLASMPVTIGNEAFAAGDYTIEAWTESNDEYTDTITSNDKSTKEVEMVDYFLSGTYSIGISDTCDFSTFSEAIDTLNSCGLNGDVTFMVDSGEYNEQIVIHAYPGNDQYKVVFEGETGDSTDVVLTSTGTTLDFSASSLKRVQNVTFRNMTISSNGGVAVQLYYYYIYDILLENNVLSSAQSDQNIVLARSHLKGGSLTLKNNLINGGNLGINVSKFAQLEAVSVLNNQFKNQSEKAIYIGNADHLVISGNHVESDYSITGVYIYREADTVDITNNQLELYNGGKGIDIDGYGSGSLPLSPNISNNYIHVYGNEANIGINGASPQFSLYYNTIYITGENNASYCLYYEADTLRSYNNNLVNVAKGPAYFLDGNQYLKSDYNNLYSNGDILANNRIGLFMLQYHYKLDSNSISVPIPLFTRDTSLYSQSIYLDGRAIPLGGYTSDIDGEIRDTEHPDIGADEFDPGRLPLSGEYTLGSGGDFTSFTDALDSLKMRGAADSVIFNVLPNTYQEQLSIPSLPVLSDSNRVIFRSSTGDSTDVTLTYTPQTGEELYTLNFAGCNFIEFHQMTLTTGYTGKNQIIELTDFAGNNKLSGNRIFPASHTQTLVWGVPLGDNHIEKNLFIGGMKAIHFEGLDFMLGNNDSLYLTYIDENTFYEQRDTAVFSENFMCPVIRENFIYASDSSILGIGVKLTNQTDITGNRIHLMNGGTGIFMDPNYVFEHHWITNNEIRLHTYQPDAAIRLHNSSMELVEIYNNTVYLTGDNSNSLCITHEYSHEGEYSIKNNILVNEAGGVTMAESYRYATSDFNCFYNNGTYLIHGSSTLKEFQEVNGEELNSISHKPVFYKDSILYPLNPALDNQGTTISGITVDIDGNPRHPSSPDMGAYEFTTSSQPMSGVYTIGSSGADFINFEEAVDSLIVNGVSDSVTMKVQSGTYEEQVRIPGITGTAKEKPVTFTSESDDSTDVVLQYASNNPTHNYTLGLKQSDYFIFENMTFKALDSTYNTAVALRDTAINNMFRNNRFTGFPFTTLTDDRKLFSMSGEGFGKTEIIRNNFVNGGYGIYATCGTGDSLHIMENKLRKPFNGILVEKADYTEIRKNKIIMNDSIPGSERFGISLWNDMDLIANNFISLKNAEKGYGMRLATGSVGVLFNSIYLNGLESGTSVLDLNASINYNLLEIKNNLFINDAGGYVYDKTTSGALDTAKTESDYNVFFTKHENPFDGNSFENWQDQLLQDSHSQFARVSFVSDTNLHVWDPYPNNSGTPLAEVTTDIDGDLRDSQHPDIGADEFDYPMPLSGTYTIDSTGGDFISFSEAVDSLLYYGVDGPVIFEVVDGIYHDVLEITEIPLASECNTITFTSQSKDSTKVTLAYDADDQNPYTIMLDGADYIHFEQMTLSTLDDSISRIVHFKNGANYNRFSNNFIHAIGGNGALIYFETDINSFNTFERNLFEGGFSSFYMKGSETNGNSTGNVIHANTMKKGASGGIITSYQSGMEITGNQIIKSELTGNEWSGIWLEDNTGENLIANNMISVNTDFICSGITLKNCTNQNVFHNSVLIRGNNSSSRALDHLGDVLTQPNLIRNNIFANYASGPALVTKMNDSNYDNLNTDYNVYFSNSDRAFYNIDHFVSGLANWQSETGRDNNSLELAPGFLSDTNLHTFNLEIDGTGEYRSEVTVDIDGEARNTTHPDIGADEFDIRALAGIYTIGGSSPDYEDFASAVEDMRLYGVQDNVTFNVEAGTYSEQVQISGIARMADQDSITFQSAGGDSTQVVLQYEATHADSNYVVCLENEDYITLRGMTLKATGADYGRVVDLKGSSNNQFLNNVFESTSGETLINKVLVYSSPSNEVLDSNNLFKNNLFSSGSYGLYMNGIASTVAEANNQVLDNQFKNQVSRGIYMSHQNKPVIRGNTVETHTDDTYYGIYVNGSETPLDVRKNQVNVGGTGEAHGIFVENCDITDGTEGFVANNFVHLGTSGDSYGIETNSQGQNFYFNSVNITNAGTYSIALYSQTAGAGFKNNILVNQAGGYAGFIVSATEDAFDYNNYYTDGSIFVKDGAEYYDLDEWYNAKPQHNANSLSVLPEFKTDTNLHLLLPSMDSAGIPISGIKEDIDGDARDSNYPDIGADEFDAVYYNLGEDVTACFNDSVTLDAGAGYDAYEWSNGETSQTIKIGPDDLTGQTGYIKVTVTHEGYELTDSVAVTYYNPVADAGNDTTSCHGATITLDAGTTLDCEWHHETEGLIASTSSTNYTFNDSYYGDSVSYETDFVLNVIENVCTDSDTLTVTVYAVPEKPAITEEDGQLVCSVEGTDYDWYRNMELLSEHTKTITPGEDGMYEVIVYNGPCFSEMSEPYNYEEDVDVGIYDMTDEERIRVYPNPAKDKVSIQAEGIRAEVKIKLFNALGSLVREYEPYSTDNSPEKTLDVSGLNKGMYFLQVAYDDETFTLRIILE